VSAGMHRRVICRPGADVVLGRVEPAGGL